MTLSGRFAERPTDGSFVVIGDLIRDVMVQSQLRRLSPESPTAIIDAISQSSMPGGAANVALFLARARGTAVLITAAGSPAQDADVIGELEGSNIAVALTSDKLPIPTKTRHLVGSHIVTRIDQTPDWGGPADIASDVVEKQISRARAIVVSDYGLNLVLGSAKTHRQLNEAAARGVPVVWDFHPAAARIPPPGVFLKFNLPDFLLLAEGGSRSVGTDLATWVEVISTQYGWAGSVVTLGGDGALVWEPGSISRFPTVDLRLSRAIGAGDCFSASLALGLAEGRPFSEAAEYATKTATSNLAARESLMSCVAEFGSDFVVEAARQQGKRIVSTGGCFDVLHAGHVDLLRRARDMGDVLIVLINDNAGVTRLKGPHRPRNDLTHRIDVLRELRCVDAVIPFHEPTPVAALRTVRPNVYVKGSDYRLEDLPEREYLDSIGCRVEILPRRLPLSSTRVIGHGLA